ncbi:hypothetical protein DFH11DRAFT_1540166 [Phellopilus nigrolimitatus]|nr:hypothetical protein DFH11DRAFT_1540166 [Phellopilus nigrolimitatus]
MSTCHESSPQAIGKGDNGFISSVTFTLVLIYYLVPVELLDLVALQCDQDTSTKLARTSRSFRRSAERSIYREISLDVSMINAARIIACFKTLASRPSLALHVKHFTVKFPSGSLFLKSFRVLLSNALKKMTLLESLKLYLTGSLSYILHQTAFSLKHFSSSFDFDDDTVKWLETQNSIETLEFRGSTNTPISIRAAALPRLKVVSANLLILAVLVPLRGVEIVRIVLPNRWLLSEPVTSHLCMLLAFSTGPLSSLTIRCPGQVSDEETSQALGKIPSIITGLTAFRLEFSESGMSETLVNALLGTFITHFQSIYNISLASEDGSDVLHNALVTSSFAERIHKSCPRLIMLYMGSKRWFNSKRKGWHRDR